MENDLLKIANEMQFNEKAEAQAVYDYTNTIDRVLASTLDEEAKTKVIENIKEIISDELNHQEKLQELYVFLTGIEPNVD